MEIYAKLEKYEFSTHYFEFLNKNSGLKASSNVLNWLYLFIVKISFICLKVILLCFLFYERLKIYTQKVLKSEINCLTFKCISF